LNRARRAVPFQKKGRVVSHPALAGEADLGAAGEDDLGYEMAHYAVPDSP
jgi:hypothetical protein